jgi:uncharacterized protein YjbI with pentapeptide repeats
MSAELAAGERWSGADGLRLRDEVLARLLAGAGLDGLGLGELDGRIDLRGLPLADPAVVGSVPISLPWQSSISAVQTLGQLVRFEGVRLVGLDLRGARWNHARFFACELVDSRFDVASCVHWRMWDTNVSACSFVDTDLRNSSFGGWRNRGNVFTSVDFRNANLAGLGTSAATYMDCDFSDAMLTDVNFWQSSLIRCKFGGLLEGVKFDGRQLGEPKPPNPMEDVDLSGVIFKGGAFFGVSLDRVRMPADPDLIVIRDRSIVERARAYAAESPDPGAQLAFLILDQEWQFGDRERWGSTNPATVINLRDIGDPRFIVECVTAAGWKREPPTPPATSA